MSYLLFKILSILLDFMEVAIFIDIILSFVGNSINNTLTDIVHAITEPLLSPGKKLQDKLMPGFMIDFSPVLALFIIYALRRILSTLLI